MNLQPVCTECGIFMRCKQNGHVVGFQSGRRYDSDQYECAECGAKVALLADAHHPEPTPLNAVGVTPDTTMREDQ
jgi:hypothetical protein